VTGAPSPATPRRSARSPLADLGASLARLHRRARDSRPGRAVDLAARAAPRRPDVRDLDRPAPDPGTRTFWRLFTRAVFATEAANLSLLHVLTYVNQAGSVETLIDTSGGAQQDRVVGGTARIAELLAEELGDAVRLGRPRRGRPPRRERRRGGAVGRRAGPRPPRGRRAAADARRTARPTTRRFPPSGTC
jgi:monoamine oxidase